MQLDRLRNSISLILLVLFLTGKMAGLHTLSHDGDNDHRSHCSICDFVVVNDFTPTTLTGSDRVIVKKCELYSLHKVRDGYSLVFFDETPLDALNCRPPPFV